MNTIKIMIVTIALFAAGFGKAQVSVNVSIGSPPPWGPAGYTEVRYYYLPDIEAYYDVQTSVFIYYGDGIWVRSGYLPSRYSSYDLYYGYKVVITDYRGESPYDNFSEYKIKYKKGYRGASQKTIGNKPGNGGHKKSGAAKERSNGNGGNNGGSKNGSGGSKNEQKANDKGGNQNKGGGNGKKK
jgi:hypothetical protein